MKYLLETYSQTLRYLSRPAWDAWIEIISEIAVELEIKSRPAWDAWIEISLVLIDCTSGSMSRPAWDAWIEIMKKDKTRSELASRVPHGTRGLKSLLLHRFKRRVKVASRMGRVD